MSKNLTNWNDFRKLETRYVATLFEISLEATAADCVCVYDVCMCSFTAFPITMMRKILSVFAEKDIPNRLLPFVIFYEAAKFDSSCLLPLKLCP